MIFEDILPGESLFVDANTFIFFFGSDPILGPPCEQFFLRIENQEFQGFTSAHVLSEVAHRLMTIEARTLFGWPSTGIAQRLKHHPAEVQRLNRYRRALDEISLIGIGTLLVTPRQVSLAADLSRQTGLLSSDALIVTIMRDHGFTALASHDADFDRVPGLVRYAPV